MVEYNSVVWSPTHRLLCVNRDIASEYNYNAFFTKRLLGLRNMSLKYLNVPSVELKRLQ